LIKLVKRRIYKLKESKLLQYYNNDNLKVLK